MATASNAKVQIESGQSLVEFEQMTDAGDNKTFTPAAAIMSSATAPVILPDGVVTGLNLIAPSATTDAVAVSAFSAASGGTVFSVGANAAFALTRPLTDVAKIVSVCMDSSGALQEVEGVAASGSTFVATRGAAGGPPLIPVGSVELGQVLFTTSAAAVVVAGEIRQNGQYTERSSYPVWSVDPIGRGLAAVDAGTANAHVTFNEALPAIHTGTVPKGVYAQYYAPSFADVPRASNFVPAEVSHSSSSTETYDGPVGSSSQSLGQGSFTALLDDGVQDLIVANKDKDVTVKFYPNRNASANLVTQGKLGIARSFPVSGQMAAACTISAAVASAEFAS